MQKGNKFKLILVLGCLAAIGPFSIDMYLPGFPAIAKDLDTTVADVSLSLSSFFIGISLGQLFYGPLLDRFGRKPPLYFGLVLYIIATIGCAFAGSVQSLIALRFLQALGGCVGMVAARAMVRDLFPVEENAQVFSMLILVIGVSPIIAPTIGGYITSNFGWHSVFIVLSIMSIALLAVVHFTLPESREPDANVSLIPRAIISNFFGVFKNTQFFTYTFTAATGSAGLYAYISGSPYVFMELFKVSEQQYGWIFALIACALISSSQLNHFLLTRYTSHKIIIVALSVQVFTSITLVAGSAFGMLGLFSTISLIFIFIGCQGFTFPNGSALSIAPFARNAGTASALMGFFQMSIGAVASAIVSVFSNNTAIPMVTVMASCAVLSLMILMIGSRIIKANARLEDVEQEALELIT